MKDIRTCDPKILMYITNNMLRDPITLGSQAEDLLRVDTLSPTSSYTMDSRFRFRILDRKANHRTGNSTGGSDRFEMSKTATGTFCAVFFYQHMTYFASHS